MKRSEAVILIAVGTAIVAAYAFFGNDRCVPDQNSSGSASCSNGSGGHAMGSSSDSDTSRGGFGEAGAAHGGGGE
jgi:hypothetical protein